MCCVSWEKCTGSTGRAESQMFPSSQGSETFQVLLAWRKCHLSSGTDPSSDFQPKFPKWETIQNAEPGAVPCPVLFLLRAEQSLPWLQFGISAPSRTSKRLQGMPGKVSHKSWEMQVQQKEQNHLRCLPWRALGISERKMLWERPGRNLR